MGGAHPPPFARVNLRLTALLSLGVALTPAWAGAAETEAKTSAKEALRARLAEEAKKKSVPAPAPAPTAPPAEPKAEKKSSPPTASAPAGKDRKSAPAAKQPPATVLPQVEVKKGRITELDLQIAKQERDIAREQQNTKPSEVDLALNDTKLARPLAIFGGESAQFRKRVASERVELMEAEKDILEAMKLAKTKAEKDKLQKELDELRAVRRELEKSLR